MIAHYFVALRVQVSPYANLMSNYIDAVGHAPTMPYYSTGFIQCKDRYRNQTQLLDVARGYFDRQLPISVIVIDWMHWINQGDWSFNPTCWPDPQGEFLPPTSRAHGRFASTLAFSSSVASPLWTRSHIVFCIFAPLPACHGTRRHVRRAADHGHRADDHLLALPDAASHALDPVQRLRLPHPHANRWPAAVRRLILPRRPDQPVCATGSV